MYISEMDTYFELEGYTIMIENKRKFVCPYCTSSFIQLYTCINHLEHHILSRHTKQNGRHYTRVHGRMFNHPVETENEVKEFIRHYKDQHRQ